MMRKLPSPAALMCAAVLALVGCTESRSEAAPPLAKADESFSQQVILVTVADGLDADFIADTRRLGGIPGVVSLRIARPEARGKKWGVKELPTFRALRAVGPATNDK